MSIRSCWHLVTGPTQVGGTLLWISSLAGCITSGLPPLDRDLVPEPDALRAYRGPEVEETTLTNGLKVWFVQRDSSPLVVGRLVIDAGAVHDPEDRSGLASITAAMLSEGTLTRPASSIVDGLAFLGAELRQESVTSDAAVLQFRALSRNIHDVFEIFSDVVRNPGFPVTAWERVAGRRVAEIIAARDNPQAMADQRFAADVFGMDHPYGRPTLGTEQALGSLSVDDVRAFHRAYYRPDNALLVVVGDVSGSALLPTLERVFGGWEPGGGRESYTPMAPTAPATTTISFIDRPGSSQSQIRVGYLTSQRQDPALVPLMVLSNSLSGRISQNLRASRGIAYSAGSVLDARRFAGVLRATASVQTESTAQSVSELIRELREIQDIRPVTAGELNGSRQRILLQELMTTETNAQIAGRLSELFVYNLPMDSHDTFRRAVGEVSLGRLRQVLAEQGVERLTIVVVGDRMRVEEEIRELGYPLRFVD